MLTFGLGLGLGFSAAGLGLGAGFFLGGGLDALENIVYNLKREKNLIWYHSVNRQVFIFNGWLTMYCWIWYTLTATEYCQCTTVTNYCR